MGLLEGHGQLNGSEQSQDPPSLEGSVGGNLAPELSSGNKDKSTYA